MRAFSLIRTTAATVAVVFLAGCSGALPNAHSTDAVNAVTSGSGVVESPSGEVTLSTVPLGANHFTRWDGLGDAQFGMDGEQVGLVWAGELGHPADHQADCYHLIPVDRDEVAMMFEDGRFVRYSVANDDLAAPGGGKRGMSVAQIESLYPGRVERAGHEYLPGGYYLRIAQENGGHVLVFETDPDGTVSEWRVGLSPPVDYVEGCS